MLTDKQRNVLPVPSGALRIARLPQEFLIDGKRGLLTAVVRGWRAARGEVLGVIDGDLQYPPAVLLQLLEARLNQALIWQLLVAL